MQRTNHHCPKLYLKIWQRKAIRFVCFNFQIDRARSVNWSIDIWRKKLISIFTLFTYYSRPTSWTHYHRSKFWTRRILFYFSIEALYQILPSIKQEAAILLIFKLYQSIFQDRIWFSIVHYKIKILWRAGALLSVLRQRLFKSAHRRRSTHWRRRIGLKYL